AISSGPGSHIPCGPTPPPLRSARTAVPLDGGCAHGTCRTTTNRPCGSCRTLVGERGRGTRALAWFEATGPGLPLLNTLSPDHDLVTAIEVDVLGGAGGQLQDAVGAPHEP